MDQFRAELSRLAAAGAAGTGSVLAELADRLALRTVVLVEGDSDRIAVEVLAQRAGHDLPAAGACVVPMGGAMSIARYLRLVGPAGIDLAVRGLCDQNEESYFRRGLDQAGVPGRPEHVQVCVADLEDEMIRALGLTGTERVVAALGNLRALRTFENQPFQRDRPAPVRLRRFIGTTSGRKARYARAMAEQVALDRVPAPLHRLLNTL